MKRLWYRFVLFVSEVLMKIGYKFRIKTIEAFPDELGIYHPANKTIAQLMYSYNGKSSVMAGINNISIESAADDPISQKRTAKKSKKDKVYTCIVDLVYQTLTLSTPEFVRLVANGQLSDAVIASISPDSSIHTIPLYELSIERVVSHISGEEYYWTATLIGKTPNQYLTAE